MKWIYEHWIITTIVLMTCLALIVAVTLKVFWDPPDIPAGTATAFGTFFGLPALVIGLLKWRHKHDGTD